ncbi:MAG: acyltransferase family protein, partial [Pseudomonas sp.]
LNYEMFFYLLFSLVFLVRQQRQVLLVTGLLLIVSEVFTRAGLLDHFYRNNIVYEFLLGIGIGVLYRRGWVAQGLWLPVAMLVTAALAIHYLDASRRLLHWGVPSALIVLACVSLERYFSGNRVLKALGDCSYSVYLVHVLVLYGGWFASERFHLSPYAVFAGCIPLIAALSWVSYLLLEKRLYHRLSGWLAASASTPVVVPLSRQNY